MLFTAFLKKMEEGSIKPVYLITGEESFLHHEVQRSLKEKIITAGAEDFDLEIIDGNEFQYDSYVNSVRSLPLLSPKRLIFFKHLDAVDPRKMKNILSALSGDLSKTAIVFSVESKPDFKPNSVLTKMREQFEWVDLSPPRGNEFGKILRWMFQGKELEGELIAYLAESKVDLWQIHGWIKQSLDYLGSEDKIGLDSIRQFIDLGGTADIWAFTDAVGKRDLGRAQILLNDLLKNREKPGMIMFWLKELFIHLNIICKVKDSGRRPEGYAEKLKINAYRWNNYCNQSVNYTSAQVEKALLKIQEADTAAKTSRMEYDSIFTELLIDIIGRAQNYDRSQTHR